MVSLINTIDERLLNHILGWTQFCHAPREDWFEVKLDIMRRADYAKFIQHPELAAALLATEDAELIEDSPSERYWGVGPDGQGLNWAGRVLMEVRQKLAEDRKASFAGITRLGFGVNDTDLRSGLPSIRSTTT